MTKARRNSSFLCAALLLLAGCWGTDIRESQKKIVQTASKKKECPPEPNLPRKPPGDVLLFDPNLAYLWVLDTDKGSITIELQWDVAPIHVTNVIYLTNIKFYDGSLFYRIVPGFVAEGGSRCKDGSGGLPYTFESEIKPGMKHDHEYLVGSVNYGKDTDAGQFYVTFAPAHRLDGKHAIFGKVVEGRTTLEAIKALGTAKGRPKEMVRIVSAQIKTVPHKDGGGRRTLPAPKNVQASTDDGDKVHIQWSASADAKEYRIRRAEGRNGTQYASAWQTDTFYDDRNARPGTEYYYWVEARNGTQSSALSDPPAVGRRPVQKSQAGRLPFEAF